MHADERRWNDITESIIGAAYAVSNALGVGFLEKVYENALHTELTLRGLKSRQQHRVSVHYRGYVVGEFVADLLVEEAVLVELKHCTGLDDVHTAQCLNYLKATGPKICLLINFGHQKIEIKRLVHKL